MYLERNPSSGEAQTHRNKIKTLQDRIAEEKKKAAATPPPSGTSTPPPPPEQTHTVYPWIVVGGGVVALAVGIVLLATVPTLPAECDAKTQTCNRLKNPDGSPKETEKQYQDRQADAGRHVNQPIIGGIVTAGGAVLIAGGLLWHFLEPTGPKDAAKTKVQPQLGSGYAGLAFTHRF